MTSGRLFIERSRPPGLFSRPALRAPSDSPCRTDDSRTRIFGEEIALTYPTCTVEQGKQLACTYVCGGNWHDFYVKPVNYNEDVLNAIQSRINQIYQQDYPSLKSCGLWTVGMPCVARYSYDNKWYRARLEDITYSMVRFVDFGNPEACPEAEIKPLTRTLAEIAPPAVFHCTIIEAQYTSISPLMSENPIHLIFLSSAEQPYEVALTQLPKQSMACLRQMVKENLLNSMIECSTSETDSPPRTIDDLLRVDRDQCTDKDESPTTVALFSPLVPVPVGGSAKFVHQTDFLADGITVTRGDHSSIHCQTDVSLNVEYELHEQALEEARQLRENETDFRKMLALVKRLHTDIQAEFFQLMADA